MGNAEITVTASDGELDVSDQFNVVVNNVNDAPVAVSPISSISRNEGFGSVVIDLATVFVDPDGDAMTYGAVSSNTNVVTVLLSGTTLTISEVGNGLSTITVTASDGELSTDDQFTFTINNINDEPEVVQPIGDRSYDEGFNAVTIGLSTRFSDPDGDVLTYKALSSNTDIATVSVSGSILTIREVGLGSSEITVTATDDGEGNLSVSDVFTLTVLNVNDAPQLDNPIANQVVDEYFGTLEIDLSGTFSDPDDDALIITATSNNIGVVTVNTVGSVLRITEVGLGLSWITVTASDGALSVSTQLEGFGSSSFSLAPVFLDPDGDLLTLSVSSSNTSAVIVSISGTTLTITETGLGVATIMVTASDGSLSANDQFTVTVNNVNDRPVVNQPISDRVVDEHFGSIEIDLSSVFSDPDVGDVLTYSAVSSNNSVVEVSVTGAILTITEAGLGTATITVTATDDGEGNLSKSDQFTMTVNNVNDPPIVANPVPDQIFDEHFGSATIDLSATFSDPDAGTILSLSVVSSNPSVVTVSLSGTILTMNETGLGTSTVSVTADDGVLSVDDQFTVTVNDVNDPPAVVAPLADQEVDEYFGSVEFDLTGVFNDPDGDVLTFTAESNANGVVTVEVTGTMLTVTEAGLGSANITVTASDGLLSAETGFMITVFNVNDAPDLAETIPDQYIVENIGSAEIDLDSYFFDRDGDALVYSVAMRDAGIVTYEQDQSVLTLQPAAVG
ncbi:MAG: hypothetical protein LC650_03185, partial [Actinobacteria bacterium]|nr:hypothetical protein [Actinomycetota bacterium]